MPYLEEAAEKPGPELFKELLRIYPAEVEDYYKNGQWRMDILKSDFILVSAHRAEGGAPDPIPLEEVVMPELPETPKNLLMGWPAAAGLGANGAATTTSTANVAGPVAELRLIALFVAKWKLEPTKTKTVVAKLTANRRRYVIQNFKTENSGDAALADLEKYIEDCEKDGAWDKDAPATTTTTPAAAPTLAGAQPVLGGTISPRPLAPRPAGPTGIVMPRPTLAGAVRPIQTIAPPSLDPSKRPRLGLPLNAPVAPGVQATTTASTWGASVPPRPAAAAGKGASTTWGNSWGGNGKGSWGGGW